MNPKKALIGLQNVWNARNSVEPFLFGPRGSCFEAGGVLIGYD